MSDQEDAPTVSTELVTTANATDKVVFDVPDVNDEAPLFLGFIYSATRSKGKIEEDSPEGGPGEPIYSAYVFPYAPPDDAIPDGSKESPLFVAYVFPFLEPTNVILGGGGGGGHAALGGHPGQILFYGRIKSFIADEVDDTQT